MANRMNKLNARRVRRAIRTRARIMGTASTPRLTVFRSHKHISAQLIDDAAGKTLAAASDRDVKDAGKPVEAARAVGKVLAERAAKADIKAAVFDRGRFR